jgi:RimJ/RimL family protein N-acetyltransferase
MKNPLLIEFPEQFETERLLIRAPRRGDGAALNAAVRESLEELRAWMPWAQNEPSIEESEANTCQACANWLLRTELRLMVFQKKDGLLVGISGLHHIDWDVPKFETGYWQRTSLCGRGLMTEAVMGIAEFAFDTLQAKRIEIHCSALNEKSAALARRAGFKHEATLRNYTRWMDTLHDVMIFTRLAGENA